MAAKTDGERASGDDRAVPLAAGAIFFVVATIFGYLTKVSKPKYPPRNEV